MPNGCSYDAGITPTDMIALRVLGIDQIGVVHRAETVAVAYAKYARYVSRLFVAACVV